MGSFFSPRDDRGDCVELTPPTSSPQCKGALKKVEGVSVQIPPQIPLFYFGWAAVTKYHKLGGISQQIDSLIVFLSYARSLRTRCQQGHTDPKSLGENACLPQLLRLLSPGSLAHSHAPAPPSGALFSLWGCVFTWPSCKDSSPWIWGPPSSSVTSS